ncbi:Major facilitator superfamily domain containing protein [Rhypophila decipiens]
MHGPFAPCNPQLGVSSSSSSSPAATVLHGPKLWLVIAALYLGIYLVALELTMLSTVIPTLTNEFGTLNDVSWYESAYVLALCVFIPPVGKMYDQLPIKLVYLGFMALFELGILVCALANSSPMFIAGRVVNGIGSAGLVSGALLIIGSACDPSIRPLVTAAAMSMISIGSMTGPIIAGVLTARSNWRWCFWMLLPLGAVTMVITAAIKLPELNAKAPLRQALKTLHRKLDPLGFFLFAAATIMLLLVITWGGGHLAWSSPTIIGLLCGGLVVLALFVWSAKVQQDQSLIPPSCFHRRSVFIASFLMFLQGGATQIIPFFLPLWFQAILDDDPSQSAVRLLPSLIAMVLSIITFGALVRKLRYVPPWAIIGSMLTAIGSGLLSTLRPDATVGQWLGYQVLTHIGRGIAFQAPVIAVQEDVPVAESAMSLAVINLFMQLGLAVSVSAAQTIFRNQLPLLLDKYAPDIDAQTVIDTGATSVRELVSASDMPGFLQAYNLAITNMFYFSTAAAALACLLSFALPWKDISTVDAVKPTINTSE